MLKRSAHRGLADFQGLFFGLPPGITPEQWPLDPNNGYPLMHGFTLLLPEDYRVHGPEIVALSFFATAPDHNHGMPFEIAGSRAKVEAMRTHPRLYRSRDILECDHAAILLTQAEFDGALCRPPAPLNGTSRGAPDWLTMGSAASYRQNSPVMEGDLRDKYFIEQYGEIPPRDLAYNRAIRWTPRKNDPNAGIAPREEWASDVNGYQSPTYDVEGEVPFTENPDGSHTFNRNSSRQHEWAKDHKWDHIGGTMRPTQEICEFSPYYIEFSDDFGGYNFGSAGHGQLDLRSMKFDWTY